MTVRMAARSSLTLWLLIALLCPAIPSAVGATQPSRRAEPVREAVRQLDRATSTLSAVQRPGNLRSSAQRFRKAIVGGYDAVPGEWIFMAFVGHLDTAGNVDFVCSGTVISPNVVLTAGHCGIDDTTGAVLDPSGFGVFTGRLDVTDDSTGQVLGVSKVIVNPAYDGTGPFDAALLVLSTPTRAQPIPLATSADHYLENAGTGGLIAGWGDDLDGSPFQTYLRWAQTVVQRPGYCAQYEPVFNPSSEICTVNPPNYATGTCNGDSGGPLVADDASGQLVELGITSHGPSDCDTVRADYFTSASSVAGWANGWIKAVAPLRLPTMTRATAKSYARQALAGALGRPFRRARGYQAQCSRKSSSRFKCTVKFSNGPNDYHGNVAVYYLITSGKVSWNDNYTIHWVDDQCYFHSGHPRRCKVHTKSGS